MISLSTDAPGIDGELLDRPAYPQRWIKRAVVADDFFPFSLRQCHLLRLVSCDGPVRDARLGTMEHALLEDDRPLVRQLAACGQSHSSPQALTFPSLSLALAMTVLTPSCHRTLQSFG